MKNYRKLYKEHYRIEYDTKQFDIHHIDENRENNRISNLILLPKRIHHIYHYGMEVWKCFEPCMIFDPSQLSYCDLHDDTKSVDKVVKPIENALKSVIPWVKLKKTLDRQIYYSMDDWKKIIISADEKLLPIVEYEK